MKLNVILAKTDALASSFRACINDYYGFFTNRQGEFKGERKTYDPGSGMIDLPNERGDKRVVTTVDEKFKWFEDVNKDYIDCLFAQEATNASNTARADLIVNGIRWGNFSSLELLRLKSMLENGELEKMYNSIPTRSDSEIWVNTTQDMYSDRAIYESTLQQGEKKSITKEQYILPDPNITRESGSKYTPQIATKDTIITLGNYTYQKFSGEWSHRQKAELLRRKQILSVALTEALKTANEVDSVTSHLTARTIFAYLHRGELA